MAKRGSKNNKASDDAVAEAEAAEQAEANVSTVASPGETGPIEPLVDIAAEFDREASERVLVAAAGILSSARIVVDEATQAAAPFLSFSQKARIQGMANSFEQQASVAVAPVVQMPSAVRTRVVQDGGGITREEVQTLIDHQVEMAVQRGLGAAGVSPDVPLDKQIERVIEGVVQSLENRLMDYVRKVLTETMEAVEESIDARFEEASEVEVNSDAQVDDRELSDSIAEVRSPQNTVSYDFAGLADIREVRGTTGEVVAVEDNIMVAAGTDDEIAVEMAAEDDEIAVEMDADSAEELSIIEEPIPGAPDEESAVIELAAEDDEEIVAVGDDEEAVEAGADDEAAEAADGDDDVVEAGDEDLVLEGDDEAIALEADDDDEEIEAQVGEGLEISDLDDDDDSGEISVADDAFEAGESLELEIAESLEMDAGDLNIADAAAQAYSSGDIGGAKRLYQQVLAEDPEHFEALIAMGDILLSEKDYQGSLDRFAAAEKVDNSRPAASLGMANVHYQRKQFNKAIRHYTQCLKLDGELAQAFCNRGLSYYYQSNYKKAFLDLMKAYELDPKLPNIKKYLKLVRDKVKSGG